VARVIIFSAARVSLSQTPAAPAKLWNKFFAMSAYKRAIPLRSISISSVEAKTRHAMAWPANFTTLAPSVQAIS
jgi:hypothetical protein